MTESNAITVIRPSVLQNMNDVERAAKAMAASGFFQDTRQLSQAIVKILAGSELGFGPFASMTGVHIIQGKPTLAANLMAAAVKRTNKYNYRVTEHTDAVCELAFFEGGQEIGRSRFGIEDATKAGLMSNPTWKKYPRNMLFARALSNGQKWFAPDIFGGATVYTPEELGANVDGDGNVIDLDSNAHSLGSWDPDIVENGQAEPPIEQNGASKVMPRAVEIPVISVKFLMDEQIVASEKEATYLISLLMIDGADVEQGKKRIELFNSWRKVFTGQNDKARKQAAEKAIAGEVPGESGPPF